ELLYTAQLIYSRTYQTIPLLIAASIWYLIITSVLTMGQYYVERYFGRGSAREQPPTPLQRLRRIVFRQRPPAEEMAARLRTMGAEHGHGGGV
ncbi:MAG: hypothetical protein ACRDN9_09060, partial [Streptosporangiaceae bacterium]